MDGGLFMSKKIKDFEIFLSKIRDVVVTKEASNAI
jgi:hypothetical protein